MCNICPGSVPHPASAPAPKLPQPQPLSWRLVEPGTRDRTTGRTMYGAAVAGDVRIEPGTVVLVLPAGEDAKKDEDCSKGVGRGGRKGPFSKKARSKGISKDKAELEKEKKKEKDGEVDEDGEGQQAMEVEGGAQEEKGEEEQPAAPAAPHWRERYGLVQCIFEEAGQARVQVGKGG